MLRSALIRMTLVAYATLLTPAFGSDTGTPDILRLSETRRGQGEATVAVQVINDQGLSALDIPLRFGRPGDPIDLIRVEFTERVEYWDVTHAQIDNQNKTVILDLIAVLGRMDQSADLEVANADNTVIANLIFRVDDLYEPSFETFTTEKPYHELTFLYYEYEDSGAAVESYIPTFHVDGVARKTSSLPTSLELSRNVPNPFNASTKFTLSLPEASDYEIRIYNVAGQLVKTYEGHSEAGEHSFTWNGSNDHGGLVASGVYFYRAKAGEFAATRMMMLLK